MTRRAGFIGLGAMGDGMSKQLIGAGYAVRGHDVRPEAVERLAAAGGEAAATPAEAARDADLLLVAVFTAAQADEVLFGADGAVAALPRGATVAMHTTMSPGQSQALERRLEETGHLLLDAPVTGGVMGADAGTLTFICSGSAAAMDAAREAFEAMGSKIAHCGDRPGAASTVKMINQLLCGVHVAATCEGLALAVRAGADPRVVYDVIASGSARSFVWETRVPTILARDYEPRGLVDIFTKDLGIVLEAGKDLDAYTPVTATVMQLFLAAAAAGHSRRDDSSLVKIYEQIMGIDVAAAGEGATPPA